MKREREVVTRKTRDTHSTHNVHIIKHIVSFVLYSEHYGIAVLYVCLYAIHMGQKTIVLLPSVAKKLQEMGHQIKLARLRRSLPVDLVAERANISRTTLWAIEKGSPSVSMGAYVQVLLAIGLVDDILLIAKDDILGRKLQDLALPVGKRASKR